MGQGSNTRALLRGCVLQVLSVSLYVKNAWQTLPLFLSSKQEGAMKASGVLVSVPSSQLWTVMNAVSDKVGGAEYLVGE